MIIRKNNWLIFLILTILFELKRTESDNYSIEEKKEKLNGCILLTKKRANIDQVKK
jgi:hypothetical protein